MADIHQARYYFEHQFLPAVFYDPKINLPISLKQNPDAIRQNWKNILLKNSIEDIYPDDAWGVQGFELDPHNAMYRILCPAPQKEPQCYWIYLFFRYDFTKIAYFTVESGGLFGPEAFLCSWDREHKHQNHGNVPIDIEKALDAAIPVFLNMPPQNAAQ